MKRFVTPTFIKASLLYVFGQLKHDPIFIVGTGRCGSSLLVEILKTNPQIEISQNEHYYLFLKALKKGHRGKALLTDITDFDKMTGLSLKKRTLLDRFFIKVLFKYLSHKASKASKAFMLKSPAISLQLNQLYRLFPDSKFIHLYRNPYPTILSLYKKEYFRVKRYQEHFIDIEFLALSAKYWNISMEGIERFMQTLPKGKRMEFSYEKLTETPDKFLNNIKSFIKVTTDFGFPLSKIKSTNFKADNLSKEEIKAINNQLGDIVPQKGYQPL